MDNKEYENRHEATAKKFRIIGPILLVIGLGCVITAFVDFFATMNSKGFDGPSLFWLFFVGFPFIAAGISLTVLGNQRRMTSFFMSQNAPAAKDYTNYMLDGTSDTIAKTAGKVASEIHQAKAGTVEGVTGNTCAKCGFVNPAGAKFCSKCGASIVKKCPYCGAENDDGAKYCNSCGKSLL